MAKSDANQRTESDFVKDLDSVLPRKRKRNVLDQLFPKDPIPEVTSFGAGASGPEGSGQGIASPLTEQTDTREFYETERTVVSSDGFFSMVFKNVSKMTFNDAQGAEVIINYQDVDPNI